MAVKQATRDLVHLRAGGNCEICGGNLPENWALHHRKLRKHGGNDNPENLLALHHNCHNLGKPSAHLNPAWAYKHGYLVHSWDKPEEIPAFVGGIRYAFLMPNGTYKKDERTAK